jgi:superfamily II DNA or RNA helicase
MNRNKNLKQPTLKTSLLLTPEYKENVRSAGYLGRKGYTIPKSVMTEEDIACLKEELLVKPVEMKMSYGAPGAAQANAFPVYKENDKKMYLPRFYGIERYGLPDKSELQEGDDIDVSFDKPLRDYQENIISVYMNHIGEPIAKNQTENGNGGILEVPCGRGKCMSKDTPIMMFDGSIKMVQDVQVGDKIMGDDSTPRNVLTLARGKEMMYKVIPNKGDSYTVNESHILSLRYSTAMNKNTPKGTVVDMSVLDYLNLPKSYHGRGGPLVGYRVPIRFPKKDVDIDPYLLGYWLGDGSSNGTAISTQESSVLTYLQSHCFPQNHHELYLQYTGAQYDYRINSMDKGNGCNSLMNGLRKYNLIKNKHIPHDYKCNDRETQLALLAGIIDSDGSVHDNCYDIIQKNETLLDDIIFLARSLGFAAYKKECKKTCIYKGEKKEGTYYRTCIHGKGLEEVPVKCPRKKVKPRKQIKEALNTRIRLEQVGIDNYYGFEIDGNRRFVLGDFTVTHNTVMALKIISNIQKKTLIIVHKEFLMNQWIERIQEFLPGARVGKIQGQKFDIEDKDIVIGMLQSLYDKDYGPNGFQSFGLTIVDEVHRIGSEQFSKTLLKVTTPNMLGISATVDRKDGLTKVLYMFIGNKIYSEERKDEDPVCVRAIHFHSNDDEFNEVETDYRGNTKYSTMITKLCAYNPRTMFIIKILQDLLSEDPDKQIMVLCHNRSLLTAIYQYIKSWNDDEEMIGYYVGGMKQADLEKTEKKRIVLATYAMAAEALDIKTLSTLVMVTPKTDITQSVGRILRVKHAKPIIVDLVDQHDPFQKQWIQRRRYYKKCNYKIIQNNSKKYTNMDTVDNSDEWKVLFDPKDKTTKMDEEKEAKSEHKCLIAFDNLE